MIILAPLIGYFIGSFQTSFIVGRFYGIDIRKHGSKNAGMTNVNRTLGKLPAFIVFVVDILKAILAFVAVPFIIFDPAWSFASWSHVYYEGFGYPNAVPGLLAGFGAILGHNFPYYLKFKGGKGIACTLGIILMLDLRVALISFVIGFIIMLMYKYISLASLAITLVTPLLLIFFGYDAATVLLASLIGVLAWFMHRENISRLLSGTERKFKFGKSE